MGLNTTANKTLLIAMVYNIQNQVEIVEKRAKIMYLLLSGYT
jgi:hypothetical protein